MPVHPLATAAAAIAAAALIVPSAPGRDRPTPTGSAFSAPLAAPPPARLPEDPSTAPSASSDHVVPGSHRPPVEAPVIDPFRPPAGPYAPGNRGIEYDTVPGQSVRASADGRVAFAGAVGGALHVSIDHADGLRTSYSFLASVSVVAGEDVVGGAVVGTAGESLHFGVRRGTTYLDPALVLGGPTAARLVPHVPAGSPSGS